MTSNNPSELGVTADDTSNTEGKPHSELYCTYS